MSVRARNRYTSQIKESTKRILHVLKRQFSSPWILRYSAFKIKRSAIILLHLLSRAIHHSVIQEAQLNTWLCLKINGEQLLQSSSPHSYWNTKYRIIENIWRRSLIVGIHALLGVQEASIWPPNQSSLHKREQLIYNQLSGINWGRDM